ncbi:hypothetical protein BS47DRAFT_1289523 [Hydnum rufescens UP504]|uniref:Uncharacterized protein n=1 Tax=Hydnum rufescens UP504 TaxID=1448309 RepID=A0A9P6DYK3_9AGAM|nr:hypothetical protein BS47DRAFT_1289523 [Hydnum rufescens UP504]
MAVLYVDLCVGTNKGHPTTPIKKAAKLSHRKGIQLPKQKLVQSIVHEVAGHIPYKCWVMELLQNSKVCFFTSKTSIYISVYVFHTIILHLGMLLHSKHKLEELSTIIAESRHAH